jgi:cytochrome P450
MEHSEEHFRPAYPTPAQSKSSFVKRFFAGNRSWIHVLFEKSYSMKMGRVRLPKSELFTINEPDTVKRVMVTEVNDFPKNKRMEEVLKPLLGESIFTTNGEIWKRQRNMIDPAFVHTRLLKVFPLMNDAIQDMVGRINNYDENQPVHIDIDMTHVTADIIFRTILSTKINAKEAEVIFLAFNEFQELSQKIMTYIAYGLPTFFLRRKNQKAADEIRAILAPIIRKRFDEFYSDARKPYDDILDSLLNAKDEKDGSTFTYEELVDHVSMLFLAGHETSASALTWSLYLIANCPHTQKALHDEVEKIAPGRNLEFNDIKDLALTRNVFNEALRLYPPVGSFLRETAKTVCAHGKTMKKGSWVMISPWLMHRHRKQWVEPDLFIPERFDNKDEMNKKCEHAIKNSYIPFGAGPRICIGKGFALQESAMVLANLVKNFEFKMKPGHVPEVTGRVTVRPDNGVKLMIKKRANSAANAAA